MPKRLILSAILLAKWDMVRFDGSIEKTLGIVASMSVLEASSTVHVTVKQFEERLGHYGIDMSSVESSSKSIDRVDGVV